MWAVGLSLTLHGVPAILLSSLSLLERLLPPPPVTWEIVPAKRQVPPSVLTPPPEPVGRPLDSEPPKRAERPSATEPGGRIGKPTEPKTPALRSLHGVGPESMEQDLGLRLLLRLPEVARSPHRQAVAGLLGAFPDSRLLSAGSSLASGDALAEALFQSAEVLVIATTDPSGQRRTATALIAVGRKLRLLHEQLTLRRVPTWDDRELLFDGTDLLAFLPRPVLPPSPPAADPLSADAGVPPSPPSLVEQLPTLRRSLPKGGPPLSAEIFNVHRRLRLRGGLPTPTLVQVSLSADLDPQVRGRLVLASPEEAAQLREALLGIGDKLRGDWRFKLMGISTVIDHLQFVVKGSELLVSGFVTGATLHSLLGVGAGALQIIPSGAPPPPPDLLPPPLRDGGVDAL